jgi:hypothetical protein
VDLGTAGLAHTIAFLDVAVSDAPEWWDLKQISDSDAINTVYNEVSDFALSFLPSRRNADPQAAGGAPGEVARPDHGGGAQGGGAERPLPEQAGRAAAVVVRQVQASLEL